MSSPSLRIGRTSELHAHYVVTTVTRGRAALFIRAASACVIRDEIGRCDAEGHVETLAWIAMPDHVHWLLRLNSGDLAGAVRAFKSRSARSLNSLHGCEGVVWQSGYHDHRLRDHEDLRAHARYIVFNAVRSGLVARPEDYPHWWCRWIARSSDVV